MNLFQFFGLLKEIYSKKKPDLNKIQKKGLLAVKIAQHYALRIDFLDQKVCRHLAKLYRNTLTLPNEDFNRLLHLYTYENWISNFSFISQEPFASASVGQVHMGELKNNGKIIVKLIKDDFTDNFLNDIKRVKRFFKFVIFFYPKLKRVFDPIGILSYIEDYTLTELNLLNEIKGQQTLIEIRDRYKNSYDFSKLSFPRIFEDLSSERILVSEFAEGKTFDELLTENKLTYQELLDLFSIHGFYMFGPGVFHGDIHPGNIIYGKNKEIILIDCGAVTEIDSRIRKGLFRFFQALCSYDYKESAKCIYDMSLKTIEKKKFLKYEKDFFELYKDFKGKTVSDISLTKKMMETIKLGVNSGMDFGKGMFGIIKSLMYLDGMVLRCNPKADLIKDLKSYIGKFEKFL